MFFLITFLGPLYFSLFLLPGMSNEVPWASFLVSLYEYLIFCVIPLLWCIYKGCGSMEMKNRESILDPRPQDKGRISEK